MSARIEMDGMRTSTGLNSREHWCTRARRVTAERFETRIRLATAQRFRAGWRAHQAAGGRLRVTLTRCSPATRPMDDDNLPGALKAVRDEVADWLGRDDGDRAAWVWQYAQRRGPWGVELLIEEA
jgi:hypothetical protein